MPQNALIKCLNIVLSVLGMFLILAASFLWLGTKDDWDRLVGNAYWHFFFSRLLFDLMTSVIVILIIGVVNWLILRIFSMGSIKTICKILIINFSIFVFWSMLVIIFIFNK